MKSKHLKFVNIRHSIATLFVCLFAFSGSMQIHAQSVSVTLPQSIRNKNADLAPGIVTNASRDANIVADSVARLAPKFMRWPEGLTGNVMHFDKNDPSTFKIGINNHEIWWLDYMGANKTDLTVTPQFGFDQYISLCKEVGAEPIVIIGISGIYDKTEGNMTREQIFQAAKDFVEYANITNSYHVKYWEIGNEDDLNGASIAEYCSIFNELVPQLKKIDPSIQCGANYMSGLSGWKTQIPLVQANADFYITHSYSWLNYKQYADWYKNEAGWNWASTVADATTALAAFPSASQKLFVTEISSYSPQIDEEAGAISNVLWKGLLNIQMNLEVLGRPYTNAAIFWNTRWNDEANLSYNAFSPDYTLTPNGLSIAAYSNFLYNNLGGKIASTSGYSTLWVSHNDDLSKMSVFLMNRAETATKISVTINGYKGNFKHEKWVYSGDSPSATEVSLSKKETENISGKTFSITLPPLSLTILNFNDSETATGALDFGNNQLTQIYPNPLNDCDLTVKLNPKFSKQNANIKIINTLGILVFEKQVSTSENTILIDRSVFTQNVYFLNITYNSNDHETIKLISSGNENN